MPIRDLHLRQLVADPYQTPMQLYPYINIIVIAAVVVVVLLNIVPMMVWFERKGSAFIQDRLGPNRAVIAVGPLRLRLMGALHNLADAIKLAFKEDIVPASANRFYFFLAPFLGTVVAFTTFAVIPFASPDLFRGVAGLEDLNFQVLKLDAGVLWILAIASFSTFSIMLAGWAGNSKFGLFGSLRAGAQMVSYELTLGLSIVGIVMIAGSLEPQALVKYQDTAIWPFPFIIPRWGIILQPLSFVLFLTCIFAETNRTPFDLAEGESELVAGYHVEYSSLRFALFFLAEYVNMTVGAMLLVVLFLGGWSIPFFSTESLLKHPDAVGLFMGVAGAIPAAVLAFAFFRLFHKRRSQPYWGDLRDHEAAVLGGIVSLKGFGLLVLGLVCWFSDSDRWPVWLGPTIVALFQIGFFMIKVLFFLWLFVWVRWSVPRFRYDQVMTLGWKVMLPLALANVALTGLWLFCYDALFK